MLLEDDVLRHFQGGKNEENRWAGQDLEHVPDAGGVALLNLVPHFAGFA